MAEDKKPGIDAEVTTDMSPLLKENPDGTKVEDIRSVQLNEKLNETTYQILHPETDAYQVITNSERRFVSDADKEKWNISFSLGAAALHYVGPYVLGNKYYQYDVVSVQSPDDIYGSKGVGVRYFVYLNDAIDALPGLNPATGEKTPGVEAAEPQYDALESNLWRNINFESYLAEFSKYIKIEKIADDNENYFNFALLSNDSVEYDVISAAKNFRIDPKNKTITIRNNNADSIVLNGSTGTVTASKFVGDLEGTAEVAKKYTTYERDEKHDLIGGIYTEKQNTPYIDDSIELLHKRIDGITNGEGGAVLANGLTIQKNGVTLNDPSFTGREAQTVNIQLVTEDITNLLDGKNKIKETWLPDSVVGGMEYIGTFNATTGKMVSDLRPVIDTAGNHRPFRKGDYAIAVVSGNMDPNGATHAPTNPEVEYFLVGDWAVCNGDRVDDGNETIDPEEWSKIDNTDSVRTVNSRIGDVKTYQGAWAPKTPYYEGDLVQFGDAVYVCVKDVDNKQETFPQDSFLILGRVYKADDGITLTPEDNTFRHTFKGATDTTVENESVLKPQDTITVSKVILNDVFGHVKNNITTTYKLPDDTWRPVNVNGEQIQTNLRNSGPLSIKHDASNVDRRVEVEVPETTGSPDIIIKHNANKIGAGSHTSELFSSTAPDPITTVKIQLGSRFTAPNFEWGDTGHVDGYSKTIFELPENLIQHEHFNIAKTEDGTGNSVIRAFTDAEYKAELESGTADRKFYSADKNNVIVIPSSANIMAFNGKFVATGFQQTGRLEPKKLFRAVDESAKTISGQNFLNEDIAGIFDATKNAFVLGDSGIHFYDRPVVYSAIAMNKKGIGVAGGQILEFGTYDVNTGSSDPSDSLVIGGLFFRNIGPKKDSNGI